MWLLVAAAGTLHGIAREAIVAPRLGAFQARQLAVLTGSLPVFVITVAAIRWIGATDDRSPVRIGLVWEG